MSERDAEMLGVIVVRFPNGALSGAPVYLAGPCDDWQGDYEPGRWHAEPVAVAMVEVEKAAKEWHIASHEVNPARMSPDRVVTARRRLMHAIDNLDAARRGKR